MNRKWCILLLAAILWQFVNFSFAEDITITTYYPAPYGVYQQMQVGTNAIAGTLNVGVAGGPTSILNINGTPIGTRTGVFADLEDTDPFSDQWQTAVGVNIGAGRPCVAFIEKVNAVGIMVAFLCDLRGAGCTYDSATGNIKYIGKFSGFCGALDLNPKVDCRYLCFD